MMTVLTVIGWVLLWILIGIVGLLALIALLLCVPVHLLAEFGDSTRLRVRYGPVRITLMPGTPKPKKEKKPKKKQTKKEKQSKKADQSKEEKPKKALKETLADFGIPDHLPDTMAELVQMLIHVGRLGNGVRHSFTICYLRLTVVCGGSDAAEAAINYGRAWPMLLGVEQLLGKVLRMKEFAGAPVLDYHCDKQQWKGEADIQCVVIRIVAVAVYRALRIFGGYRRIRKIGKRGRNKTRQSKKGVTVHEQSGT